ncbi:MAG: aspartate/glutamate racemase family protein [Pseudomonadota bacterium]
MKQRGGKPVFGACVGILMLDGHFPRVPGDMGNALTWPFPVQYRVVGGASPDLVVRNDPRSMTDDFIEAARDLVRCGADGITTNCGFLALIQDELQSAVPVPVATSSLMQVPMVSAILPPGKRVGILTISKATLTNAHLDAAGAPRDTPVVGTDSGQEFTRAILGNELEIDFAACRNDMIAAADELLEEHSNIGAIVLECTNMVPYAADIRRHTGLPVFSIYSFVSWFQAGLVPPAFSDDIIDTRY